MNDRQYEEIDAIREGTVSFLEEVATAACIVAFFVVCFGLWVAVPA